MSLLEPLTSVIASIDRAADEIANEIHASITKSDSDGLERKSLVARRLLELRKGAESLLDDLSLRDTHVLVEPEMSGPGSLATENRLPGPNLTEAEPPIGSEPKEAQFTPAEVYGRFVLLGFTLLGGTARYRDAQTVMFDCMQAGKMLKAADLESTGGTTRPRVLAQSSSYRTTLMRRQLLMSCGEADFITDLGRAEVLSWIQVTGRSLGDFIVNVPSNLVDLYFHGGNYFMALWLLGGRATDLQVIRVSDRLQKRFPILQRKLRLVNGRALSPTHVETYSKEKFVKLYANGELKLTSAGQDAALAQLNGCEIPERELRLRLPRRKQR